MILRESANGRWAYRDRNTGHFTSQVSWHRSLGQRKRYVRAPAKPRTYKRPAIQPAKPAKPRAYKRPAARKLRGRKRAEISRRFAVEATIEPHKIEDIAGRIRHLDLDDPQERHLAHDVPLKVAAWDDALSKMPVRRDKTGKPRDSRGRFLSEEAYQDQWVDVLAQSELAIYAELMGLSIEQVQFALDQEYLDMEQVRTELSKINSPKLEE